MAYLNHWIHIQSFKHNGDTHRLWDRGLVLEDNNDYIVVATKRAKVIENNGRAWFTKEPAVTIFSKKHWFNVICMLKKAKGITYYCNIASPCIVENSTIKYVDYDLDIKLFPNGTIRILDEKEYLAHKEIYGYSEDLNKVLYSQLDFVRSLMEEGSFPFSNKKIEQFYEEFEEIIKKKK